MILKRYGMSGLTSFESCSDISWMVDANSLNGRRKSVNQCLRGKYWLIVWTVVGVFDVKMYSITSLKTMSCNSVFCEHICPIHWKKIVSIFSKPLKISLIWFVSNDLSRISRDLGTSQLIKFVVIEGIVIENCENNVIIYFEAK